MLTMVKEQTLLWSKETKTVSMRRDALHYIILKPCSANVTLN